MAGPNHYTDQEGVVLACPSCDRAGQLYQRQDGSVRCNECGEEHDEDDVVVREDRRGSNLTLEDRSRGGQNTPGMSEGTPQGPRESIQGGAD